MSFAFEKTLNPNKKKERLEKTTSTLKRDKDTKKERSNHALCVLPKRGCRRRNNNNTGVFVAKKTTLFFFESNKKGFFGLGVCVETTRIDDDVV